MKTNYKCKANDNRIRIVHTEDDIFEIHVKAPLDKGWIVIAYNDIHGAVQKAIKRGLKP